MERDYKPLHSLMSWQCWCGCINVNVCKWCNYCRARYARISLRPAEPTEYDDWDEILQERELQRLDKFIRKDGEAEMTPQEQLYAKLFSGTKIEVKDMDALTLRAYREQLSEIAFEARAKLAAVDDELNERKPKRADKGFQTSLGVDDNSKQIINTINERQKRLTKQEKLIENMIKLGMSRKDAEEKLTAGVILGRLKMKATEEPKVEEPRAKFSNPFEKK